MGCPCCWCYLNYKQKVVAINETAMARTNFLPVKFQPPYGDSLSLPCVFKKDDVVSLGCASVPDPERDGGRAGSFQMIPRRETGEDRTVEKVDTNQGIYLTEKLNQQYDPGTYIVLVRRDGVDLPRDRVEAGMPMNRFGMTDVFAL